MSGIQKMLISMAVLVSFGLNAYALEKSTGKAAASENRIQWVHDFAEGLAIAKKTKKPIMVDFYADWCGWCRKLDTGPYRNARVIELANSFVCVKINTDVDARTPSRYGVRGLPTIVFLDATGGLLTTVVGYRDADFFAQTLAKIKNKN